MVNSKKECVLSIVNLIPALQAFARRFYHNSADADDLVQETLCRALAHIDQFQVGTNLKSWLFTILRNTALSKLKNRLREAPGLLDCVADRPVVPATQEWAVRQRELELAIGRLRPEQRDILITIGIEGLSYEDAAKQWGCKVGTIKSRLNCARAAVLRELGEHSLSKATEHDANWVPIIFEADRRVGAP